MESFGTRLRVLRSAAGLTQAQLADRIGVSSTYISALESGRKPAPPRAIVAAMASALGSSDVEMWGVAQAEREARLRDRIHGVPASCRQPLQPCECQEQSAPDIDALIDRLRVAMSDQGSRQRLADALDQLSASLRSDRTS